MRWAPLLMACALGCAVQSGPEGGGNNLPSAGILPFTPAEGEPLLSEKGHSFRRPWVLPREDGGFRMWLSDQDAGLGGDDSLLIADSPDGITWDFEGAARLLPEKGGWEAGSIRSPCVRFDAGEYILWYTGGEGAGIGVAVSKDGLSWTRHPGNPVLEPAPGWESEPKASIDFASVTSDGATYRMYYLAGDGSGVGIAESADGLTWERTVTDPVLTPAGDPGDGTVPWDRDVLTSVTVSRQLTPVGRAQVRMWYGAGRRKQSGDLEGAIGFAGSYDGTTFVKMEANPAVFEASFADADPYVVPGASPPLMLYTRYWKKEGDNRNVLALATGTVEALVLDADAE